MSRRLLLAGITAVLVSVVAVASFAKTGTLRTHSAAARASASEADQRRSHALAALRWIKKSNLRTRKALLRIEADADPLAAARTQLQRRAFRAAREASRRRAYPVAYRDAFPIELDTTSWFIVRVRSKGGYHAKWWRAPQGREYVIDAATVTSYEPGTAPDPYLVGGAGAGVGDGSGYVNSDGVWVPSPSTDPSLSPAGPTALCADGTYSYSQHASGTCSWHGGVAQWNP